MNKENKKQLILSLVAVCLIVTGYFNFQSVENEKMLSQVNKVDEEDENIGDVELVSSNSIIENIVVNEKENKEEIKNEISNNSENNNLNNIVQNEIIVEESIENNYFEKTRLDRENMYSRMLESYNEIINNDKISSEQKAIAIQEVSNINNYKNGIMISENLIKNKGFDDVVILINNNTVSVVVKKEMLLDTDIVKIQNIIETKLGFDAKSISISNV